MNSDGCSASRAADPVPLCNEQVPRRKQVCDGKIMNGVGYSASCTIEPPPVCN